LSGRVCGTAAGSPFAREAEGQVEGALSFASFCLPLANLNFGHFIPTLFFCDTKKQSQPARRAGCLALWAAKCFFQGTRRKMKKKL
jgi:hypothetical protein